MKTDRFILAVMWLLTLSSCGSYYRMRSEIDRDGSLYREVYAFADSAFRAGDRKHNPFMFEIGEEWKLTYLDSVTTFNFWGEEEKLNVKVSRRVPMVDGVYFTVSKEKEYLSPLTAPSEVLKKKFRWFYTYYTYTATYRELPEKGPVPLSTYMTEEEQLCWFRGDCTIRNGLNGIELNEKLNDLEAKFEQWYVRSYYEINWNVIRSFVSSQKDTAHVHLLDQLKDEILEKFFRCKDKSHSTEPSNLCKFIDETCGTTYFSELYSKNQKAIDLRCEDETRSAEVFYNTIQFELTMPGRLLSSNASNRQGDLLIWKVDGFRLLVGDYVLAAESRTVNYWAFAVTVLLILIVMVGFLRAYRKR